MLHLLGESSVSCAVKSSSCSVRFCVPQLWEGGTWGILEVLGEKAATTKVPESVQVDCTEVQMIASFSSYLALEIDPLITLINN